MCVTVNNIVAAYYAETTDKKYQDFSTRWLFT